MSFDSFKPQFDDAMKKSHNIIFSAHCNISYSGRAESILPWGDRIVLIKSDKTMLIHQNKGSAPVNYMKEASFNVFVEGDYLVLTAENMITREFMRLEITNIFFFHDQTLIDEQKIQLVGTEKDMAEMIMRNPHLISENFKPLSLEEQTKFGFIDVFGHNGNGELVIVECKRYCADLGAVTQLRRYVEKIKEMKGTDVIEGIIAAPKITPNALTMLEKWGFKFVRVNPPKYLERFDKFQTKLAI